MKIINFDCEYYSQTGRNSIDFGYIDKTVCGVGITSVVLENEENAIILVPNIALVENKIMQYPNNRTNNIILGLYGEKTKNDVERYIKEIEAKGLPVKILSTYDSLWKCEHLIDSCRLIIDESDRMIGLMHLKNSDNKKIDVVNYMLNVAEKHKDKITFISATPTNIKYLPEWISTIPMIRYTWSNTVKVSPILYERTYPNSCLVNEILIPMRNYEFKIKDRYVNKGIIFINSVEGIMKAIKDARLSKEDVAILCSDSSRNDLKIRGFNRIENPYNLPRFTFITSSGFQGIDLYDEEAVSIVVSNTSKHHTMINSLLDLKQAVSRNRCKTNPNFGNYIFIYNQTIFNKSEEEISNEINDLERMIKDGINILKRLKGSEKDSQLKINLGNPLFNRYTILNPEVIINQMLFNADREFILETRSQFTKGFNMVGNIEGEWMMVDKPKGRNYTNSKSYKTMLEKFNQFLNGVYTPTSEDRSNENFKMISEYYYLTRRVSSDSNHVKNYIEANDDAKRIRLHVRKQFSTGRKYPQKEALDKLSKVYSEFGIKRRVKVSDLNEYFKSINRCKIKGEMYIEVFK